MRLATALARRRLGRPGLAAAGFCWRLSLKPAAARLPLQRNSIWCRWFQRKPSA